MSFQRVDADKYPLTAAATERIAAGLPEYFAKETTPEFIHLGDIAIQLEISNGAIGVVAHDVAFTEEPIGRIQTAVIQRRIRVKEAEAEGRPAQKVRGDSRFFCTHAQVELINDHYCARGRSNKEIAEDLEIMPGQVTDIAISNDMLPVYGTMPGNKGPNKAFYGLFNLDQIAEIKSHEEQIEAFRAGTKKLTKPESEAPDGLYSGSMITELLGLTPEQFDNIIAGKKIKPTGHPDGSGGVYLNGAQYKVVGAEARRRRDPRKHNEFHHHNELANRGEIR